MRVLITGASGLLGGRLIDFLFKQNKYTLSMLTRNSKENNYLKKYGSVIDVDWENQDQLNDILKKIDVVIHAFGPTAKTCLDDPINQISLYKKYTHNLLKASELNRVSKIILLSSIHVYSENPNGNIDEESSLTNNHPYALSKIVVEDLFNKYPRSDAKLYILRLSNCYGYPITRSENCWNLFVNNICKESIENNSLIINNNPYDKRDFLPISYFCEVICQIIKNNNIKNGLYNLTSGETKELIEFSNYIKDIINKTYDKVLQIKYDKNYNKTGSFTLSNNKILSQLSGISIDHEEEIKQLYKYCKDKF